MKSRLPPVLTTLVAVIAGTQLTSAATILASADSRSDTSLTAPLSSASTSDLAIGLVSAGRSFRSYLTFDLSGETAATGDTTLTLADRGANESNTSSVTQTFILFALAADWDGVAQPGPVGTALASVSYTPATGDDTGDLSFTSAALTTAFNDAVGGNLHLGISSDLEGTAARSFVWFGSIEDATFEPSLTYTPVPEPDISVLALVGLAGLMRRRRS